MKGQRRVLATVAYLVGALFLIMALAPALYGNDGNSAYAQGMGPPIYNPPAKATPPPVKSTSTKATTTQSTSTNTNAKVPALAPSSANRAATGSRTPTMLPTTGDNSNFGLNALWILLGLACVALGAAMTTLSKATSKNGR